MATNAEDLRFQNLLDGLFTDTSPVEVTTDQASLWLTFTALCIACHHPELSDDWQDAMTELAIALAVEYHIHQPQLDELVEELLHLQPE